MARDSRFKLTGVVVLLVAALFAVSPTQFSGSGNADAAASLVETVVSAGGPAPGGGTFTDFDAAVSLSDGGQVAFLATLSTGSTGIFVASSTASGYATSKVAMTGDTNPAGGTFSSFSSPSLNSAGQVAFSGRASSQPESIFLASPGGAVSVVAGTGGGVNPQTPSLNNGGAVAFIAPSQINCCQQGLFIATPAPSGFRVVEIAEFDEIQTPVSLNDSNQVAFEACNAVCPAGAGSSWRTYLQPCCGMVLQGNDY